MRHAMLTTLRPMLTTLRNAPLTMVVPSTAKPATQVQCTVALVKNIVGTGVLTLPAGISRLSDGGAASTEALTLASILMLTFGALNALGFLLIGEACAATSQKSYVGAWRKSIGEGTSFVPALTSLFLCFLGAVACATVIEELGTDLVAGFMHVSFDSVSKTSVLAAFSTAVLTPLCLLPSLAPLGSASVLGVLGIVLTGGSMAVRLADGSYGPDGQFASDTLAMPAFHEATIAHLDSLPPSTGATFFFLSLVSNAYLAHYNAPGVFNECRAAEAAAQSEAPAEARKPFDRVTPVVPTGGDRGSGGGSGGGSSGGSSSGSTIEVVNPAAGEGDDTPTPMLVRLTSTLAAEEVNRQFEMYIESVPSFGVKSAFETGYEEGYRAGYTAGLQAGEALQQSAMFETIVYDLDGEGAALSGTVPSDGAIASDASASAATSASLAKEPELPVTAADEDRRLGLAPFRRVVTSAFGLSSALFLLVAWCGFATFGDASDALILNNYAPSDPLAEVARFGILLAVLFEFPLLERPFRLTALELLLPIPQFTGAITRIANTPVAAIASVALISGIAAAGVPLDSLGALGGCTGGALLIYVAPALMTLKLRAPPQDADGEDPATVGAPDGVAAAGAATLDATTIGLWGVAATGVVLAVVGTVDAVSQMI